VLFVTVSTLKSAWLEFQWTLEEPVREDRVWRPVIGLRRACNRQTVACQQPRKHFNLKFHVLSGPEEISPCHRFPSNPISPWRLIRVPPCSPNAARILLPHWGDEELLGFSRPHSTYVLQMKPRPRIFLGLFPILFNIARRRWDHRSPAMTSSHLP
jgi:hypothetical protein